MIAAVVAMLVAAPFAAQVFDRVEPFDISDPGSEVQRAYAAYESATGQQVEPEVILLVQPDRERRPPGSWPAGARAAERLAEVRGVASVVAPSEDPALVAGDGRSALVLGYLAAGQVRVTVGRWVEDAFAGDPAVLAGGLAVAAHQIGVQTEDDTRRVELYAAPILFLLLLGAFRSLLAAILPLVLAGFSIVVTLALLTALSTVTAIDLFSLQVVTGLGVGLAIDYSLFVLARQRSELRRGKGYATAHRRTTATAGRTVFYGALTVAAALAALILFPHQFLRSTGIAGAIVVLLSGASALLILPAALALLGPRIDPSFERRHGRGEFPPDPLSGGSRFWSALSARVTGRPIPYLTIGLAVMLAIGSPAFGGQLTTPDARVLPGNQSAKRVSQALDASFADLPATQLAIIAPPSAPGAVKAATESLRGDPALDSFSRIEELPGGGEYVAARSSVDPLSDEGQAFVDRVRAASWPAGTLVGGRAAELTDQRSSISDSAPEVIAVVVLTNLLLVLLTLRSLVLPVLSIALNTLTVLASYGIMVTLFKHQATADLLGAPVQAGIDVSVPILAFAVVFGLSTDYGIFLFTRIAEARRSGLSNDQAITTGLANTGRVISSAALIFAVAVGANLFSDLVIVKEFAVAVAVAVLLDATIVRGILAPAALRLLGPAAWAGSGNRRLPPVRP